MVAVTEEQLEQQRRMLEATYLRLPLALDRVVVVDSWPALVEAARLLGIPLRSHHSTGQSTKETEREGESERLCLYLWMQVWVSW